MTIPFSAPPPKNNFIISCVKLCDFLPPLTKDHWTLATFQIGVSLVYLNTVRVLCGVLIRKWEIPKFFPLLEGRLFCLFLQRFLKWCKLQTAGNDIIHGILSHRNQKAHPLVCSYGHTLVPPSLFFFGWLGVGGACQLTLWSRCVKACDYQRLRRCAAESERDRERTRHQTNVFLGTPPAD